MLAINDGGRKTRKLFGITKDVILPRTEIKYGLGIGNITENFDSKFYLLMDASAPFVGKKKKRVSLSIISRMMEGRIGFKKVVVYIPIFASKDSHPINIVFFAVAVMPKNGKKVSKEDQKTQNALFAARRSPRNSLQPLPARRSKEKT